jgi:hypothetical protein
MNKRLINPYLCFDWLEKLKRFLIMFVPCNARDFQMGSIAKVDNFVLNVSHLNFDENLVGSLRPFKRRVPIK